MIGPDYDNYGAIDLSYHDTTPGAKSPFSPPAKWSGDNQAYLALTRRRYRQDPGCRQHMVVTAWICDRHPSDAVEIVGPYKEQAWQMIRSLWRHRQSPQKGQAAHPADQLALV